MKARFEEPDAGTEMDELVATLRQAWSAESAPRLGPLAPERGSIGPVVDALRRLHRGTRGGAEVDPTNARGGAPDRYDRVRQLFRRREESQRTEAMLVDRILDRMRAGAAPRALADEAVLQQTVRIACPAGGRSAGRFLVVNEAGVPVRVRPEIGRPSARRAGPVQGAVLRVEPGSLELGANAAREAELSVDLRGATAPAGDPIDVAVTLRDGERRLGRVWIEIVVVEGQRR